MITPVTERRKHERDPVEGNVEFALKSDGDMYQGTLKDLSTHGMFVMIDEPPPVESVNAECALKLMCFSDDESVEIIMDARIARITSEGVGLYMSRLENSVRVSIDQLLKSENSK